MVWSADPQHGAQVLRDEHCLKCHSVRGEGGLTAPNLARRLSPTYTPAALASLIWNHTPAMWSAMTEDRVARPRLSERDSEDLFLYLYSLRFFDHPGDPANGQQLFEAKHCAACHALTLPSKGPGTPIPNWRPFADPFALVQRMWSHSSAMKDALAKRAQPWVELTGQDLADLTSYFQTLAPPGRSAAEWTLPDPDAGKPLFDAKCRQCHSMVVPLEARLANRTVMEIAAGMWSHLPRMLPVPIVSPEDMRAIVAYVWQIQYLGPAGNVGRGARTFAQKGCAACHLDAAAGTSRISRGEKVYTPFSMMSLGWIHGPTVRDQVDPKGAGWPVLSPEDIGDLTAYINSRP